MLIIDRFEGAYAIVECGDQMLQIPKSELPAGAQEGSVLTLELDPAAEEARRARLAKKQNSLFL